jgi:hypothetical protein
MNPKSTARAAGPQWTLTFLTQAAPIAGEAEADKAIDLVNTGASVLAGAAGTVVNVWRGVGRHRSEVRGQRSAGRRWQSGSYRPTSPKSAQPPPPPHWW